ncbi:MAG: hypothetical protein H6961_10010 [Chromatiaceae bacterium]|nr:hypothetical protein [Chromatiaceae bacterium]
MTLLNFDDIVASQDKEYQDVDVPEWGGTVRIATMSGEDRDRWELSMMQADDSSERGFKLNFDAYSRVRLVAMCLVDDNFNRIFVTKEQIERLSQKSGKVMDLLYDVAQRVNGITDEDIDDLEKNSVSAQNGDSGLG